MAPNSDIDNPVMTTGEVYRMAKDIKTGLDNVTKKLDEYPNMRDIANLENKLHDAKAELANRVKDVEGNQKWGMRAALLALGGVILNIIVETSRFVP